jgi:hypothetical protein
MRLVQIPLTHAERVKRSNQKRCCASQPSSRASQKKAVDLSMLEIYDAITRQMPVGNKLYGSLERLMLNCE